MKKEVIVDPKEKLKLDIEYGFKICELLSYFTISLAIVFAMLFQTIPTIGALGLTFIFGSIFLTISIIMGFLIYFFLKRDQIKELSLTKVD
jgi:hypothetical protein